MGGDGRDRQRLDPGRDDRPTGRHIVSRRAGGRGHQQPVAGHRRPLLGVDPQRELDHPEGEPRVDRGLVEREPGESRRRVALGEDLGPEHAQRVGLHRAIAEVPRRRGLERRQVKLGHEPQTPEVDPQQRDIMIGEPPGLAQECAVAAEHHNQVGVVERGDRLDIPAVDLPRECAVLPHERSQLRRRGPGLCAVGVVGQEDAACHGLTVPSGGGGGVGRAGGGAGAARGFRPSGGPPPGSPARSPRHRARPGRVAWPVGPGGSTHRGCPGV